VLQVPLPVGHKRFVWEGKGRKWLIERWIRSVCMMHKLVDNRGRRPKRFKKETYSSRNRHGRSRGKEERIR